MKKLLKKYLITYDIKGTKSNSRYNKSKNELFNTLALYGEIDKLEPRSTITLLCNNNCKKKIESAIQQLSKKLGIQIVVEIK